MKLRHALVPVGAVLTAGLIAAPAASASHSASAPKLRPTSITLKAAHATTAPKHKVSLTATLKAGHQRVAGEAVYLEKRDAGTHKFSDPVAIAATDSNGQVTVPVTPNTHGKGKKEQYRVVFQGDTGYKASRSGVITVAGS